MYECLTVELSKNKEIPPGDCFWIHAVCDFTTK